MMRETTIFSPDLVIEMSGEETPADTSHIYTGEVFGKYVSYCKRGTSQELLLAFCHNAKPVLTLASKMILQFKIVNLEVARDCMTLAFLLVISGEQGSLTHGSVVDGRFEGFIKTYQGTYYVEPSERYMKDKNTSFHSVIYHEDDVGKFVWVLLHLEEGGGWL